MDIILDARQIENKAIKLFNAGFNCSQSVLSAFSDYLNLDYEAAKGKGYRLIYQTIEK